MKLAVFDVDGTLVDSREIIQRASDAAYAAMGLPPLPYEKVRQIVGLRLEEGLALLLPNEPAEVRDQVATHYRLAFRDLHRDPDFVQPLYPGAAELLARLKREGWKIAMATGKSRRGVDTILDMHRWGEVFDSTHCSDDGPGKPDPAMVLAAMHALDAEPADTVMVGDTAHDVCMAKSAGVRAVGVTWGFHTRCELEAAAPDAVLETFRDLDRYLHRFAASVQSA